MKKSILISTLIFGILVQAYSKPLCSAYYESSELIYSHTLRSSLAKCDMTRTQYSQIWSLSQEYSCRNSALDIYYNNLAAALEKFNECCAKNPDTCV